MDDGDGRGRWFFSYNHDIDHPYFAPRPGFVRASLKCQGMVGVVGDSGTTRLTWLANFDFGGLIPSSFTTGLLMGLMTYPVIVVRATKENLKAQEGGVADIAKPSLAQEDHGNEPGAVSREAFEEVRKELERSRIRAGVLRDELKAAQDNLTASLEEKEAEFKRAIEVKEREHKRAIEEKDRELKRAIEEKNEKDEQITELRRRLPRLS